VNLIPFIADSAQDAVAQIRSQLGPNAVVVHVRPLPPKGLARLWSRPKFEVLAHSPLPSSSSLDLTSNSPALPDYPNPAPSSDPISPISPITPITSHPETSTDDPRSWRIGTILERSGFLPLNAQRVVDQLVRRHGPRPPETIAQEIALSRLALADLWRKPAHTLERTLRPHVFIGAPGVGKSTCLCKWLAQTVLVENRPARLWRLDGPSANPAALVDLYGDILGVPTQRAWHLDESPDDDIVRFIDLPGVDWQDPAAMRNLNRQLSHYLSPQIHLVLNGAYDLPLLLAQIRAFSSLPLEDLIITHLDEETRWGKLWNLVLGTNCSLRFLAAGQNIPGVFLPASPDQILARQFPASEPFNPPQTAPRTQWQSSC
jgi:flagellar biosynthesis protein FlhF